MDSRVIGGVLLVCVIVVVAGVLFYNSNSNTPGVNNNTIDNNNTTINTTSPTNQLALTIFPGNQPGSNLGPSPSPLPTPYPSPGPNPNPNPGPGPSPDPDPTPDPMDNIISLFDAYLNKYYNQSLIPGMAVVIVKGDKIIYMNTFGVKDLDSGAPIDTNTLFGIGSDTKAFSATLIGQLVSKGLMSWDDPIAKYYPDLKLYDDYVTSNITIRDALSHRSGIPAHDGDLEWSVFNNNFPFILYQLQYMENTTPFRSTHQYNNIIYALGGYCAAQAVNATWSELIKEDLLDPLGMATATTTQWDFLNSPNHATPYILLKNGTMMPYDYSIDSVGPAGRIAASISEMANWLKFQINDTGYYNGVQIMNKSELDETHTKQIEISPGLWYGLGWQLTKTSIVHGGDTDAFHSSVFIYPSQNLGMVILSNGGQYASSFRDTLFYKLAMLLAGDTAYDPWPATKEAFDASWRPVPPTPPIYNSTLPLSGCAGVYFNQLYGNINVTIDNDILFCYYGNNTQPFELKHWNNNTFYEPVMDGYYTFTDISNGSANKVITEIPDFNTTSDTTTFNRK